MKGLFPNKISKEIPLESILEVGQIIVQIRKLGFGDD